MKYQKNVDIWNIRNQLRKPRFIYRKLSVLLSLPLSFLGMEGNHVRYSMGCCVLNAHVPQAVPSVGNESARRLSLQSWECSASQSRMLDPPRLRDASVSQLCSNHKESAVLLGYLPCV